MMKGAHNRDSGQDGGLPRNVRVAFVLAALVSGVVLYNEDNILDFIKDKAGYGQTQASPTKPKP